MLVHHCGLKGRGGNTRLKRAVFTFWPSKDSETDVWVESERQVVVFIQEKLDQDLLHQAGLNSPEFPQIQTTWGQRSEVLGFGEGTLVWYFLWPRDSKLWVRSTNTMTCPTLRNWTWCHHCPCGSGLQSPPRPDQSVPPGFSGVGVCWEEKLWTIVMVCNEFRAAGSVRMILHLIVSFFDFVASLSK